MEETTVTRNSLTLYRATDKGSGKTLHVWIGAKTKERFEVEKPSYFDEHGFRGDLETMTPTMYVSADSIEIGSPITPDEYDEELTIHL